MAIAALDLGTRRIGIAIALESGTLSAHPIGFIERRALARDLNEISLRLAERGIERVVVGLPLNMDGTEGRAARAARAFASRLHDRLKLPVELFDERLTSFEAEDRLRGVELRRSRRKGGAVDAVAAAVILEGWLRSRATTP